MDRGGRRQARTQCGDGHGGHHADDARRSYVTIVIEPSTSCSDTGRKPCRSYSRRAGALASPVATTQRCASGWSSSSARMSAPGDPAAEAVGVHDEAVDVDERAGALPRDRAHEPLALVGAEEVLARLAQPPRRLLQRGQRARAEQVGLDPVGGALERDDGLGDARRAEVELLDLEGHSPSAERIAAVGSPSAGAPPRPTPRARGRGRRGGCRRPSRGRRRGARAASRRRTRAVAWRPGWWGRRPCRCAARRRRRSAVPAAPRVSSSS